VQPLARAGLGRHPNEQATAASRRWIPDYNGGVDNEFGEMLDTSPARRRRYYELVRALSPEQRARKVSGLSRAVRDLAEANLRARNPGASPRQLGPQVGAPGNGSEVAARLFP
jgi:hypothetical protein